MTDKIQGKTGDINQLKHERTNAMEPIIKLTIIRKEHRIMKATNKGLFRLASVVLLFFGSQPGVLWAEEVLDEELIQKLEETGKDEGSGSTYDEVGSTGRKLTEDQAKSLEEKLQQKPGDLVTRVQLIGYYSPIFRARDEKMAAMKKYAPLILGIIENHPESDLAGFTGAMLLARGMEMQDQGDWDKGANLWMKLVDENPSNAQILGQAATFLSWDVFRPQDKAISLLEKACELDAKNPKWAERLGELLLERIRLLPDESKKAPAQKALGYLERASQSGGSGSVGSFSLAEAAFQAEEWEKAATYGSDALAGLDPTEMNFGNLLYSTHELLGRVALRKGDLNSAKQHLLESGKTPGSPQLNSFGPSFVLDRELLEKGEKAVVLEHLDLVSKFWGNTNRKYEGEDLSPGSSAANSQLVNEGNAKKLAQWKKEIEEGKIPSDFKWK